MKLVISSSFAYNVGRNGFIEFQMFNFMTGGKISKTFSYKPIFV